MTRNYNLILYQKIERAISQTNLQLDVNLDGNNLDMASETEEIQSPNTKK